MHYNLSEQPEHRFIAELQTPLHKTMPPDWGRREAKSCEVNLRQGVTFISFFDDPNGRLETAYNDFQNFLNAAGISIGPFQIRVRHEPMAVFESYRITVKENICELVAGDTEGIRRGLVYLEDEILRAGGPYLSLGVIERRPFVRTRISRCYFGPINRPPKNIDELANDINYYPDEYLNRLAHDGVNGLWVYTRFKDLIPSRVIPEYGQDSERRLKKLRQVVKQCARYGIKIYLFCIEPAALTIDSPVLARYPELRGNKVEDLVGFCTSTEVGKRYLEEATKTLFTEVPGLGGLINISVGERYTHCWSYSTAPEQPNSCPRCSKRQPKEVLAETLSAMERGMHAANPEAELISWPYSQYLLWGNELTADAASFVPENVILMHNFESAGGEVQLGKWRSAEDYWLSYIGPSELYRDCAKAAVGSGRRMFAKLQVGCSHEVATVPFVPVPGNLFKKYSAMHELGVSGAMQCWYFGNYPSVMTKAAGELSFEPMPKTEDEFLYKLALRDWGENAEQVVAAWKLFQEAYSNYPLAAPFGYYGPMHDGPVWPLYLEPRNLPLSPTWKKDFPPSGDRIGECILYNHTLEEILILCKRMAEVWNKGVIIMQGLSNYYQHDRERLKDINVSVALGLQFQSGYNILRFYSLREEIAWNQNADKLALLALMEEIVKREIDISKHLYELSVLDSRLGFHSEAEGYKYNPAKLKWRIKQLEGLLRDEFSAVRNRLECGEAPFLKYSIFGSEDRVYYCKKLSSQPEIDGDISEGAWDLLQEEYLFQAKEAESPSTIWKAGCYDNDLFIGIRCFIDPKDNLYKDDNIEIRVEPVPMWPFPAFVINRDGTCYFKEIYLSGFEKDDYQWAVSTRKAKREWSAVVRIPLNTLALKQRERLKINIIRRNGPLDSRWVWCKPLQHRLIYGSENPEEFGWLLFSS